VAALKIPPASLWKPVSFIEQRRKGNGVHYVVHHEDYDTVKVYLDLTQEDLEEELAKAFKR
jgi:hypothetical protein